MEGEREQFRGERELVGVIWIDRNSTSLKGVGRAGEREEGQLIKGEMETRIRG